jgi:hypothetical protein
MQNSNIIDLSNSLSGEQIAEQVAKLGLNNSHPKFKTGQVVEFWAGANNDIRYRTNIIGFDLDNDIYLNWDCYWFPIKDDERRSIKLIN